MTDRFLPAIIVIAGLLCALVAVFADEIASTWRPLPAEERTIDTGFVEWHWQEKVSDLRTAHDSLKLKVQLGAFGAFALVLIGATAIQIQWNQMDARRAVPQGRTSNPETAKPHPVMVEPPAAQDAARVLGRAWGKAEKVARSLSGAFNEGRDEGLKSSPPENDTNHR